MEALGNASITLICLIGFVAFLVIIFLAAAIKIVPEYKRIVVFRLGRCIGPKGPGLILLIPFIDRPVSVDLREQVREIPAQTSITQDNAPISIDFLWYYKVFDPVQSVLQVQNFELAAQGIATTTLRSVIGGILLDGVLSEREKINTSLRARLDEVTERWGVKVTNVEIREIVPPRDVQDSMNRQLTAERTRRAVAAHHGNGAGAQPHQRVHLQQACQPHCNKVLADDQHNDHAQKYDHRPAAAFQHLQVCLKAY